MMTEQDLKDFRREYMKGELLEADLSPDPYQQFMDWLEDAIRSGIQDPTAMALATAGKDGRPSVRVVLLKDAAPGALTFYTHYDSRKGEELAKNPYAAVMFFWPGLDRQVRIEGKVEKNSATESDEFFQSRPVESRIASIVSEQSREIPGREHLTGKFLDLQAAAKDRVIKRPESWGGYNLAPESYEFWQGRENRLNDRIQYVLIDGAWKIRRLAP